MIKTNLTLAVAVLTFAISLFSQTPPTGNRTVTKTDSFSFGSGGTVVITGAPKGSIEVIGSATNEVEINAEIKLQAASEAELETLAALAGFVTDESAVRTSIITVGGHNKFGLKKLPKNFPKGLINMPFTVNYVIRVPRYSDLEIDGGHGDLIITGVEGSIRANFLESRATIEIFGGTTMIALGKGEVDISFSARGWRGRSANVQIAQGDVTVRLPTTLSADVDAVILRAGKIENEFAGLKPRERKQPFTERSIVGRAGVGGSQMKFAVGEGTLKIEALRTRL